MLIDEFKKLDKSSAFAKFTISESNTEYNLETLDIFNIPLKASGVQISIYDEDKTLIFEGIDMTRDGVDGSYILLDDLNLVLESGEYSIVIKNSGIMAYSDTIEYPIIQPENPYNTVDSPSTSVLIFSALILIWIFRR